MALTYSPTLGKTESERGGVNCETANHPKLNYAALELSVVEIQTEKGYAISGDDLLEGGDW